MTTGMHENEVPVSDDLVRRLVDTQLPQYAARELRRLPPIGTDHHLFRLGEDLLVRLPRIDWAADQAASDDTWLRRLAPHLPLEVPVPVALGRPVDGYPFAWTVVPWIEGENPTDDNVDLVECARVLGKFAHALHRVEPMGGPLKTGTARGVPLAHCDGWVREWTARAGDRVDQEAVLEVWADALAAPVWQHDPTWLCGDIAPGNVIVRDRRVVAAIDFGALGRGDPAAELMPCWNWFRGEASAAYGDAIGLDAAAWRRGRGWALVPSISGLTYYETTSPGHAESSAATIAEVLREFSEA
jgi:aminoglycoside phosphotransferase (APT) family kinase protein